MVKLASYLAARMPQSTFKLEPQTGMIEVVLVCPDQTNVLLAIDETLSFHPFTLDGTKPLTFLQIGTLADLVGSVREALNPQRGLVEEGIETAYYAQTEVPGKRRRWVLRLTEDLLGKVPCWAGGEMVDASQGLNS